MKNYIPFFLCLTSVFIVNAQKKPVKETAKNSVKTEVVTIVTAYNPKISDASKIKITPKISILKKSTKKKLKYAVFTAPVASTFIPKSGKVKGIKIKKKERLYNNLFALGYGNYSSPYVALFFGKQTRFEQEYGLSAKYLAATENINTTKLNSTFSNLKAKAYYSQHGQLLDWKVTVNSERNNYNWYGLPDIDFDNTILASINEEQTYNYFQVAGDLTFKDSFIDAGNLRFSSFTDALNGSEILASFTAKLEFPLEFLNLNLNNILVESNFELLKGGFNSSYQTQTPISYSIFTAKIYPEYEILWSGFSIKAGVKLTASLDTQNELNNFFAFPQIEINKILIKESLNVYTGLTSDLHTNTYKGFTDQNPYVSPTLLITQTVEKATLFFGLSGKINHDFSFNVKGSYKEEQDKPLFLSNQSKSNGLNNTNNSVVLKGYEYGNSFGVFYDDVQTTSFFAELEYDLNRDITLGANVQQNSYITTKSIEAFNLPTLEISFYGKYNAEKWYATTNIFHVSDRKDLNYSGVISSIKTIDSFIDINLNGGYHFNNQLSAFIKLNNILNKQYQRFSNFDTQGFQVLAGIYYKFGF